VRDEIAPNVIVCNTSKGIWVPSPLELAEMVKDSIAGGLDAPKPGEALLMRAIIRTALGREQPVVALSGPTFADEVLRGFPTGAVVAGEVSRAVFVYVFRCAGVVCACVVCVHVCVCVVLCGELACSRACVLALCRRCKPRTTAHSHSTNHSSSAAR
jgi:hypothetical protein